MKRIIAFLMSLMLALSLCACQIPEVNAPTLDPTESVVTTEPTDTTPSTDVTEPSTDTTTETTVPNLTGDAEQKLTDYAVGYGWPEGVVETIRTSVPDFDTFDSIESAGDGTNFVIVMNDGVRYKLTVDTEGVQAITNDVENPTERDMIYIR